MLAKLSLVLLPLAALIGCGAAAPPPTSSTPALNLNGNWEFVVPPSPLTPAVLASPIGNFSGALQSSNGSVTGTFRVLSPPLITNCPLSTTDLPATGTLDSANNLTLTLPVSGGVATITASLPQNLNSLIQGSYQIVGGTCPVPATTIVLTQYAPVTGTYTGTLSSAAGTPITSVVNAVVTQSTVADVDGRFPINGTLTAVNICAGTLVISPTILSGNDIVYVSYNIFPPAAVLSGTIATPDSKSIQAAVIIFSSNCPNAQLQGTLTRQ